MKRITVLLAIIILPFIGHSQLKDYTFNSEGDKEGWSGAGLDLSSSPNPTGGFLIATGKGSGTGFPQMRSEVYAPLLAVAGNQKIVVTIVAENATDNTVWQIGNLDAGSTDFGASAIGEFSMPSVALGSGASTFEVEVPINPDNINGGIERFSIRAKVGSSPGLTGTIKFDRITVNLITVITENSFVSNSDFEAIPYDTGWSLGGPDATLSSTAGNGGGAAAQINFSQDLTSTSNNILENTVYDFGKTVNPAEITTTFDAMSNKTDIDIQVTIRTYDANDATVETINKGTKSVSLINTWESFTVSKEVTKPFNKILFRIRIKGNPLMGDKVAIDNVESAFSYILGIDDKKALINSFKLYPNPVKNVLHIKSLNAINSINIYDITGKNVLHLDKVLDNKINVSSLNQGIYVIRIKDVNGNHSAKKLVVSK